MLPLPVSIRSARWLTMLVLASALTGCGEDVTLQGGGAGDGDGSETTDLAPYVGIWDITGNWNGIADDEALLVFRELVDNESVAVVYDFDDGGDNCYFRSPVRGVVTVSADNRVFLSQLSEFPEATLSLGGGGDTLSINFVDRNDIDDDGDISERLNYPPAPRFTASMEVDLPVCGGGT